MSPYNDPIEGLLLLNINTFPNAPLGGRYTNHILMRILTLLLMLILILGFDDELGVAFDFGVDLDFSPDLPLVVFASRQSFC